MENDIEKQKKEEEEAKKKKMTQIAKVKCKYYTSVIFNRYGREGSFTEKISIFIR